MNKSTKILLLTTALLTILLLSIGIYCMLVFQSRIKANGQVKAVGITIYESDGVTPLTSIDWGMLEPGETKSYSFIVYNSGNSNITLYMTTDSWIPTNAKDNIYLSWNYTGQTIETKGILALTFSLKVSTTISGIENFSFDIVVVGSG